MATVWVYADLMADGQVASSALELLTKARDLGDEVAAVALGPGASDAAPKFGEYGAATMSRLQLGATQLYTLPETAQGYDVILRTEARVAEGSLTLVNAFYPAGYGKEGRNGRLRASRVVLDILERTEGPLILSDVPSSLASKEKEYGLRRSDLSIPSPTRLMRKFGFMVQSFRSCGATAILAQWRNYDTALADTTLVRALYLRLWWCQSGVNRGISCFTILLGS